MQKKKNESQQEQTKSETPTLKDLVAHKAAQIIMPHIKVLHLFQNGHEVESISGLREGIKKLLEQVYIVPRTQGVRSWSGKFTLEKGVFKVQSNDFPFQAIAGKEGTLIFVPSENGD